MKETLDYRLRSLFEGLSDNTGDIHGFCLNFLSLLIFIWKEEKKNITHSSKEILC